MTALDPARLHQSIRQLEGDGGRVDVEQLRGLLEKGTPGPWSVLTSRDVFSAVVGKLRGPVAMDLEDDDDADLIVALRNAAPALLDLIRRKEAALTAVRQLHVEGPYKDCRECMRAWPCSTTALASPDTTQDGGA